MLARFEQECAQLREQQQALARAKSAELASAATRVSELQGALAAARSSLAAEEQASRSRGARRPTGWSMGRPTQRAQLTRPGRVGPQRRAASDTRAEASAKRAASLQSSSVRGLRSGDAG